MEEKLIAVVIKERAYMYEQLLADFKKRHALDAEGANRSGLDGDRV
jgi:hypothetical protein